MTKNIVKKRNRGRNLGPYSRPLLLCKLDHRTSEAKMVKQLRADLVEHVGGNPSVLQTLLIEQACVLALRIHMMNRRMVHNETINECDTAHFLSWSNGLAKVLATLNAKMSDASNESADDPLSALQRHLTQRQEAA